MSSKNELNRPEFYQRQDNTPDEMFYAFPRMVVHIDDGAIAAASQLYGEILPPDGHILDLMSAWRTHLPPAYQPARVTGLGMNAQEMAENPQLTDYVVHNLNKTPALPFGDKSFDGAVCTVSVQYLTQPVEVFKELYRVLKPNAPAIFTFSNRCFPTKAVAVWHSASMPQRTALVSAYFEAAGFADVTSEDRSPKAAGGRFRLFAGSVGDPLMAVWAYRPGSDL